MYERMAFDNVKSYIQSGNVIFQTKKTKLAELEKKISDKIKDVFSFEVLVTVKEPDELKLVLKNNPFLTKGEKDISKLYVTFLSREPEQTDIEKISAGNYGLDEFVVVEKNIYLSFGNGYGNTKLTNNFFETKLKRNATTRNWKTVNELVKMSDL